MKSIKLVSLNLWLGGVLFDEILVFLEKENPDILLLQEAYNSLDPQLKRQYRSLEIIQRKLHFSAQDFAPTFLEKLPFGKLERGNAILSRFPITDHDNQWLQGAYREYLDIPENYPEQPRAMQHAVIDVNGTHLNVFNLQGVWDLDGDNDSEARQEMSRVIINAIKGKQNVILGGDTNARPTAQAIQNIDKHLKSVFKDELTTTFNMRRKTNPGYATSVVDMLFVSSNIQVAEHYCPDLDISDHLPLVATLQIA